MPLVTATPRGQENGQVVTEFVDTVGTTSVTYTFQSTQGFLSVSNFGLQNINVTVSGNTYTINPRGKKEIATRFSSFDIISSSGVQHFEATAKVTKLENSTINSWKTAIYEKFDDASNWDFIASNGTASTAWTVSNNKITSSGGALAADTFAVYKNVKFNDGRIHVLIENLDPAAAVWGGILLRGKTKSDLLAVLIFSNTQRVSLWKLVTNTFTELVGTSLSTADVQTALNAPTSLEVEVTGGNLKAFVNGRLCINSSHAEVSSYNYGYVGLATHKNFAGVFSNFSAQRKRFDVITPSIKKGVAVGTSITMGAYQTRPWVDILEEKLKNEYASGGFVLVNEGVSGYTSDQMLSGFDAVLSNNLPDLVLIEASINDSRIDRSITVQQAIGNLRAIVRKAKVAGAIPVLMTATPIDPSVNTASYTIASWRYIIQMNIQVRQLAIEEGVRLVDNFNAFSNDFTLLKTDKIHPIDAGARVIANTAFDAIVGMQ